MTGLRASELKRKLKAVSLLIFNYIIVDHMKLLLTSDGLSTPKLRREFAGMLGREKWPSFRGPFPTTLYLLNPVLIGLA